MTFNFPNTPQVGDTITLDGIVWVWDGVKWAHLSGAPAGSVPRVSWGPYPPTSPSVGDFWWDETGAQLYIFEASNHWIIVTNQPTGGGGGAGVTLSATPPSSASQGALWWDTASNELYVFSQANQWVIAVNVPDIGGPVMGVTDGSNAAAGQVGEYLFSGNFFAIGSVSLHVTAGDWDLTAILGATSDMGGMDNPEFVFSGTGTFSGPYVGAVQRAGITQSVQYLIIPVPMIARLSASTSGTITIRSNWPQLYQENSSISARRMR